MIRIWSDGKRTRVMANGYDITDDVISVEWEHDTKEEAVVKTFTIEPVGDGS